MAGEAGEEKLKADLDLLRDKAEEAFRAGHDASVVELLTPYLRHRPDDDWAIYLFGRGLQGIGLFHEAERALLRADEFETNHPRSAAFLAILYNSFGEYARAEEFFARATAHSKVRDWVWIFRGCNLARMNQLAAAEDCQRHALTLPDCDHDEAWLNIGYIMRARGKYAEAIEAFGKAIELTPNYPEAIEGLRGLEGVEDAVTFAQTFSSARG
jgi:tetratricopeptide (TPR) repeat protein